MFIVIFSRSPGLRCFTKPPWCVCGRAACGSVRLRSSLSVCGSLSLVEVRSVAGRSGTAGVCAAPPPPPRTRTSLLCPRRIVYLLLIYRGAYKHVITGYMCVSICASASCVCVCRARAGSDRGSSARQRPAGQARRALCSPVRIHVQCPLLAALMVPSGSGTSCSETPADRLADRALGVTSTHGNSAAAAAGAAAVLRLQWGRKSSGAVFCGSPTWLEPGPDKQTPCH